MAKTKRDVSTVVSKHQEKITVRCVEILLPNQTHLVGVNGTEQE